MYTVHTYISFSLSLFLTFKNKRTIPTQHTTNSSQTKSVWILLVGMDILVGMCVFSETSKKIQFLAEETHHHHHSHLILLIYIFLVEKKIQNEKLYDDHNWIIDFAVCFVCLLKKSRIQKFFPKIAHVQINDYIWIWKHGWENWIQFWMIDSTLEKKKQFLSRKKF